MVNQFYYKRNRLQQLRGFYYTAQMKSMSKAAEYMSLNQSAVTLQIQSLEQDLGVKLFNRDKKGLELTTDGKLLYELAVTHVQGIDSIHQRFQEERKKKSVEKVDIAAHHIGISYLLPKYIAEYSKINPKVNINIRNISKADALERLKNNEIDLMIYPVSEVPTECYFKPTFTYDPILLMRRDHPLAQKNENDITLEEISEYNFIYIDKKLITLPLFIEVAETYGWKSNIEFEMGNWEILKHFVRADVGIAMVSTICLEPEDNHLLIGKSMTRYFPPMIYGIMIKQGSYISPTVHDFITSMDPAFFEGYKD